MKSLLRICQVLTGTSGNPRRAGGRLPPSLFPFSSFPWRHWAGYRDIFRRGQLRVSRQGLLEIFLVLETSFLSGNK
jgi:hypothetical protein